MTDNERIKEFILISEKISEELRKEKNKNFFQTMPKGEKEEDVKKANKYLIDLENTPHHFVLACVMDRQIPAERAWIIPYKVITAFQKEEYIKNDSIEEMAKVDIAKYEDVFTNYYGKKLHKYSNDMATFFYDAVMHIKDRYNYDVSKIWANRPSSGDVVMRFREFNGVGQKISTMAANILVRELGVEFADYRNIDISLDKHVMHVMKRLGFVQYDRDEKIFKKAIVIKTRELNPEYPGIFDFACFDAGRKYCFNKDPDCDNCILNNICKKMYID